MLAIMGFEPIISHSLFTCTLSIESFMGPNFHNTYLLKQDSFRILRKINKCLAAIGASVKSVSEKINECPPDIDEVMCLMITSLENGLSSIASAANRIADKNQWNGKDSVSGINIYSHSQDSRSTIELAILFRWKHLIRSVYQTHDERVCVIFRSGIDLCAMKQYVRATWSADRLGGGRLILVGEKLFEHLLQHYYPFEYAHLAEFRILLWGVDILPNTPPGKSSFVDYLIGQVPLMIAFPYSLEIMLTKCLDYYLGERFEFISQNMLFLKCYLETGTISAKKRRLLADCLRHSPRYLKKTRKLKMNLQDRRAGELSWEWFKLLRPITDQICWHLATHSKLNKTGSFNA